MSFLTRVRLAVLKWWIRNAEVGRRAPSQYEDLEGIGRRLVRPPLRSADHDPAPAPALSATEATGVTRDRGIPSRLVIRFE